MHFSLITMLTVCFFQDLLYTQLFPLFMLDLLWPNTDGNAYFFNGCNNQPKIAHNQHDVISGSKRLVMSKYKLILVRCKTTLQASKYLFSSWQSTVLSNSIIPQQQVAVRVLSMLKHVSIISMFLSVPTARI